MTAIDARHNPAAAQAALDAALSSPASSAPEPLPQIEDAPDTTVQLPAGWYDSEGTLHTTAEVRELNGADEEALAKVKGGPGRLLQVILSRGVVQLGTQAATEQMLDSLLVADADALLLGIRRVTFGSDVELEVLCPHCKTSQQRTVDLDTDVPVKPLDGFRDFDVQLKVGTAKVFLPTVKANKKLVAATDKSGAELNTMLLSECVVSIGDMAINTDGIRRLGLQDRQKLIVELGNRLIGPRLEEVSLPCESCSESISLPLDMADLFRL